MIYPPRFSWARSTRLKLRVTLSPSEVLKPEIPPKDRFLPHPGLGVAGTPKVSKGLRVSSIRSLARVPGAGCWCPSAPPSCGRWGRPGPRAASARGPRPPTASTPAAQARRGGRPPRVALAAAGTQGRGPRACGPSGCRGRCAHPPARPRAQLLFKGPAGHVARTQLAAAGQELRGWAAPLRLRRRQRAAPGPTGRPEWSSRARDADSHGRGGARPGKRPAARTRRRAGPPPRGPARSTRPAASLSGRAPGRPKRQAGRRGAASGPDVGGPAGPPVTPKVTGLAFESSGRFPIHCLPGGPAPPGGPQGGQGLQPRLVLTTEV